MTTGWDLEYVIPKREGVSPAGPPSLALPLKGGGDFFFSAPVPIRFFERVGEPSEDSVSSRGDDQPRSVQGGSG